MVVVVTAVVLTVKLPLDDPLGTIRLAGLGEAAALSLENVMATPALGAGPLRLTVPDELLPPATEVGFSVTEDTPEPEVVNTTSTQ